MISQEHGYTFGCACEGCAAARHKNLMKAHPIHSRKGEVLPTLIPIPEALAMALEEKEELEGRLVMLENDIKSLRDCGGI